jgi:hypothetical protein
MEDPDEYNSYFDMIYPNPDPSKPNNKAELLAEINSVNFAKGDGGLLELPLSDLTKSRMSKVYLQYREKI